MLELVTMSVCPALTRRYFLNQSTFHGFCNQIWYGGASSLGRIPCIKIGLLSHGQSECEGLYNQI